jgi:hypothetical protein
MTHSPTEVLLLVWAGLMAAMFAWMIVVKKER